MKLDLHLAYAQHEAMVRRRIRRFVDNPHDAEDALQDVFLRALEKSGTYRAEASPSTWLYRLTTRYCINRVRNRRNRAALELENLGALTWSQPVVNADCESHVLLHEVLAELTDEEAEIVRLYCVEDRTHAEIAREIGVSRRTVGNRLARIQEEVRCRAEAIGVELAA